MSVDNYTYIKAVNGELSEAFIDAFYHQKITTLCEVFCFTRNQTRAKQNQAHVKFLSTFNETSTTGFPVNVRVMNLVCSQPKVCSNILNRLFDLVQDVLVAHLLPCVWSYMVSCGCWVHV